MARVLVVGRGAPERGGIRTSMETILGSDLARRHELSYLNLGRERGTEGGKASVDNLTRTIQDLRSVWREAAGKDVVHIHSAFAPTVTALRASALCLAARLRGARTILHLHGGRFPDWVDRPSRRIVVRVMALAVSYFAVVSRRSADVLPALVDARRVRFIPNGVDTIRFRPSGHDRDVPVILFVGVLSPRKGLLDLFEASRRLRADGRQHELWLVGGITDEGPQATEAVMEAAPEWVRFMGEVDYDSVPDVYGDASIYCLPSWWEAAPLTVLEAAGSGLPVVATRVGDVADMVEDGVTGILVLPRDPSGLAAALAKLVEDPELREQMGRRGRARAEERLSLTETLEEIDELYRKAR